MRIGIFGDSFALQHSPDTVWWKQLRDSHNHEVISFGEGGSSFMYSTRMLYAHAYKFDFQILCLTSTGRYSVPLDDHNLTFIHSNKTQVDDPSLSWGANEKLKVLKKYKELIYDPWEENLTNKALCFYLLDQYPNLMIIPCFPAPLNKAFSLFDISTKEMSVYFPNVDPANVFKKYADLRPGHMTPENNKILAELINKNLTPGIFQTDINFFQTPQGPVEQHFKAIQ